MLLQLKKETYILERKIKALNRNKEDLLKLKEQLCKVWDKMGFMLEEAAYKRTRERENKKMVMRELQSLFM